MKKMRFALIGAGKMGTRWAGVISKCPNASLEVVIDNQMENAYHLAEQFPDCNVADFRSILRNKNIDAVLIAVPHKYLAQYTALALYSGKHVLCEKPGAIKAEQIKKNSTLAKEEGLTYMIGYNCRYHDGFVKARKLFNQGVIGKLLFIRSRYGFGGRANYDKEWRINKEISGGGHLHDQGVHMIDMAKSFMGKVKEVKGFIADTFWKAGTEDNGFVLLKDENGVIASIHSSLTQWKRMHSFEIYGTKGYLEIQGLGMRYGEPERLILGKRTSDPDKVIERVIKCNPIADNSLKLELNEFISEKGNAQEAYETLKIVEEVYKTNKL
jgi:predicted dehydrogenase